MRGGRPQRRCQSGSSQLNRLTEGWLSDSRRAGWRPFRFDLERRLTLSAALCGRSEGGKAVGYSIRWTERLLDLRDAPGATLGSSSSVSGSARRFGAIASPSHAAACSTLIGKCPSLTKAGTRRKQARPSAHWRMPSLRHADARRLECQGKTRTGFSAATAGVTAWRTAWSA